MGRGRGNHGGSHHTPHNRHPRHDDEPTVRIPRPNHNDRNDHNPRRHDDHDGNSHRRDHDGGDSPSLGEKINDILDKANDVLDTASDIADNVKKLMEGDPMGAVGLLSDAGDVAKMLMPAAAGTPIIEGGL